MSDEFLKHMYKEANDLSEKVDKLTTFLNSTHKGVTVEEVVRLTNQRRAMEMYLDILNERIAAHS